MAGDDGLLVGLGDGHRIAEAELALLDQHGVAEGGQFGIVGQPVGDLDAGDLGAAVEIVEVAPLLAHGEAQGEAAGRVAGWLDLVLGGNESLPRATRVDWHSKASI